jgi:hypothetical protein
MFTETQVAMVGMTGKQSQRASEQQRKLPKGVLTLFFFDLQVGGQKGFRRSSRKRVIPLMRNFRTC